MQVELCCSFCPCKLTADPNTPSDEVLDYMFNEGPFFAMGDGETFEDMIFSTLTEYGDIQCPDCGEPVNVGEESLSQLALSVLGQF